MRLLITTVSALVASLCFAAVSTAQTSKPSATTDVLSQVLKGTHPDVPKWATVVRVTRPDEEPEFIWHHLGDSAEAVNFWPASTIKLYTVLATLEALNARALPMDSTLIFDRQDHNENWIRDCARTFPEMVSEVFRRSSNEDYTLLLRAVGIEAINTKFLIPSKGFPHSALMRDYVTYRPIVYVNEEPQRVTFVPPLDGDGQPGVSQVSEHVWTGVSYAEQRGATVLSKTTGNCTSTKELADCLRRVIFHDYIPKSERFAIRSEQAEWLREGDLDRGVIGLENRMAGAFGWKGSGEEVFPDARYFHKGGQISSYSLDLCYLSDAASGNHLILAFAVESGEDKVARDVAKAIYRAAAAGRL